MDKRSVKRFGYCSLAVFLGFIGLCLWATSYRREAVSPDGRVTAQVRAATTLGGLILPLLGQTPKVDVSLVDNATGNSIPVHRYGQGGLLADWRSPDKILWDRNGKRFYVLFNHTTEPSYRVGKTCSIYHVVADPIGGNFEKTVYNPNEVKQVLEQTSTK